MSVRQFFQPLHIVRPAMWRQYFTELHAQGAPALITRTFALEIWPALLIVVFHQVWSGAALILTVYGHLLMVKIVLALLFPKVGLRSLAMAQKGDNGFRAAGVMLMALGGVALYAVLTSRA